MDWRTAEPIIRLGCFFGVLIAMALAEAALPRRRLSCRRRVRWASNLGMAGLNVLIVRAVLPMGGVGVALAAETNRWGILNNLSVPGWLATALAFVALDFIIYLQHVMFHAVP